MGLLYRSTESPTNLFFYFFPICYSAHANHTNDVYELGKGYAINNPEVLYKNRFRNIFHQVPYSPSWTLTIL